MKHLSFIVYLMEAFLKWNGEKLKGVSQSSWDEVHDADIENIRRHMCLRHKTCRLTSYMHWLAVVAFISDAW